jgi:hypothetical protein
LCPPTTTWPPVSRVSSAHLGYVVVYDLKAELRDLWDIAPEREYARASRQDFVSGNIVADFEEHRQRH